MGHRTILECDGCKKELNYASDRFLFTSDRFTDAAGSGDNTTINLYFCGNCLSCLKQTLKKMEKRYKEKEEI